VDRSATPIFPIHCLCCEAAFRRTELTARQVAAEDLELDPGEQPYDIAFAVPVRALDGRQPRVGALSAK